MNGRVGLKKVSSRRAGAAAIRLLRDAPACVSGLRCRSYRYASVVHDS